MLTTLILAALAAVPTQAPKPAANTLCPVRGEKVTPGRSPKRSVRGQEYYLCCAGCESDLAAHPDLYLHKDGTPKNAKGKVASQARP